MAFRGRLGLFTEGAATASISVHLARAAVMDIKVFDPVNRDIVGATIKEMSQG